MSGSRWEKTRLGEPSLNEIRVMFDRDMGDGMSWTGDGPLFPPVDESRNAKWIDRRTCVLPVKLDGGHFYRIGINSTDYQNFRSADSIPTPSSVIYFVTKGDRDDRIKIPQVAFLEPANRNTEVDPDTNELRVTFDIPMNEGMSWCGEREKAPVCPTGQMARWSEDGRTCILPVKLEPGHDYEIGLNSSSHINFQSKWGVPLAPVKYAFRTRAANP